MHIPTYASLSSHKPQVFAMLMQIKEGGRKHVETSKAAMFKLERQKTTAQRKRIDKEERIEYSRIE